MGSDESFAAVLNKIAGVGHLKSCKDVFSVAGAVQETSHFREMGRKNRKIRWHEAVSFALNFPCLKEVS